MSGRTNHFLDEEEIELIIGAKNKKRISLLSKFVKKVFSPVTRRLDGIDVDYSDRSRTRRAFIAVFKLKVPIHDIRYSHAAALIEMNVAPKLLQERLGHERIQTTLDTYGHLYPNKQAEVAKQLDEFMSQS